MHFRMFVTTSQSEDADSLTVRSSVFHTLASDDSFCGSGGLFGSTVCDWFEIGGRWSGILAIAQIGETYRAAVTARFPEMANKWLPHSLVLNHGDELDALWRLHGGIDQSPFTRNDGSTIGFTDDALLLTEDLYATLLAQYQGNAMVSDAGHFEYVDLDQEQLQPDFVGRKWVVVIDYHN